MTDNVYFVDPDNNVIGSLDLEITENHPLLEEVLKSNPWLISFEMTSNKDAWIVGFYVQHTDVISYTFEHRKSNSFVLPQELRMAQLLGVEL